MVCKEIPVLLNSFAHTSTTLLQNSSVFIEPGVITIRNYDDIHIIINF